jgi:hypothetical protein
MSGGAQESFHQWTDKAFGNKCGELASTARSWQVSKLAAGNERFDFYAFAIRQKPMGKQGPMRLQ